MKLKYFTQKVIFKAEPEMVYKALMDSKIHSKFTGATAQIGKNVGDTYSAYDGYIEGKNIELIPGKKIVQTWKAMEDGWPDGDWSQIEITLTKTIAGTELNLIHSNISAIVKADFETGWKDYYWKPMKALLEK